MNQISLTDLAKNRPMEPLLEKEVQARAYELYERRGKGHGFALQDWLEAEAELLRRWGFLLTWWNKTEMIAENPPSVGA